MPWPELPDTSDQMPAATQPPLDELSRARYRREANTRRREARSKANELRELGRIAAMMLQTRGLPPNQMIADAEQGEGNAWLATLIDADEVATGPSAYLLFAGRIATEPVRGLIRLDDCPPDKPMVVDLGVAVSPVTFDEEFPDHYWNDDGSPADESSDRPATSIGHMDTIRAGIQHLLQEADII
jgi:hypothetical protein